jgi:hypothetical protein
VIGSSTDAVSLDGSSLLSLEPHEGALPGAPDTFAAQIIPVHFAKSPAYRKTLQPWRGAISHGVVGNLLDHFVGGTASRAKRMLEGLAADPGTV